MSKPSKSGGGPVAVSLTSIHGSWLTDRFCQIRESAGSTLTKSANVKAGHRSQRGPGRGPSNWSNIAETVYFGLVSITQLGVSHPQSFPRCKAKHANLPLMKVGMDVLGRLAGAIEGVGTRERRMDPALNDQPVRLPGLSVVREMRTDDPFEIHPQVPVVVLVQEP